MKDTVKSFTKGYGDTGLGTCCENFKRILGFFGWKYCQSCGSDLKYLRDIGYCTKVYVCPNCKLEVENYE